MRNGTEFLKSYDPIRIYVFAASAMPRIKPKPIAKTKNLIVKENVKATIFDI